MELKSMGIKVILPTQMKNEQECLDALLGLASDWSKKNIKLAIGLLEREYVSGSFQDISFRGQEFDSTSLQEAIEQIVRPGNHHVLAIVLGYFRDYLTSTNATRAAHNIRGAMTYLHKLYHQQGVNFV